MPDMRKQQQQLQKQLEKMLQDLKDGKMSQKELAKKLSQMYGQQELLQMQLQQMMQQMNLGPNEKKSLNEINQMLENMNRDLINKNVSPQLLQRQQMILDKMLETEKSMNKKEEEEKKRESEENRLNYEQNSKKLKPLQERKTIYTVPSQQILKLRLFYNDVFSNYLNQNQ